MPAEPLISDDELVAGVRAVHGDPALPARVRKRRRLRPTQGLTGSYFERVQIEVGGERHDAILKQAGLDGVGPAMREGAFFREVAPRVPVRVPRVWGVGPPRADGGDAWVLMEALPRGKRIIEWSAEDTDECVRNLARLHAAYLHDPPAGLPRPFTDDLERTLAWVPAGADALRRTYAEWEFFPRVISERSLDLACALAARPEIFAPFGRSPQTLLHGDYHRGNVLVRDGEPQALFDWQFACAGPPAYDLAVYWLYLGIVTRPGFLRFFDRTAVRERERSLEEVLALYGETLRGLRPDADTQAIAGCMEHALAWEPLRQVTYFAGGLANFEGYVRFIYRDHRTIGGWFARWLGIEAGWRLYEAVFGDFEQRAQRLLADAAGVAPE